MTPIKECLINKSTKINPIWLMRQAGRYLPEFREIRKKNPNFIELCLNPHLSEEITLQPIKRFNFDAAIIFSDILMVPYGMGQSVEFKKNLGPNLGNFRITDIQKTTENDFKNNLLPIYKLLSNLKKSKDLNNKDLIGFVGAPWTLLVYMINKKSPKLRLIDGFFDNELDIKQILVVLEKFLKIHVENQIKNGANVIQIFDSWAGLLDDKDLAKYIYDPTLTLVEFIKSLKVPVICFPRGIKNYKEYCEIIKPDAICIDYEVDPKKIEKEINIPVQGGMDPKILLADKDVLKKEAIKYLDIFKDHPYIFNLGHGVLPETDPNMMEYLVKTVKDYK